VSFRSSKEGTETGLQFALAHARVSSDRKMVLAWLVRRGGSTSS
jgi:hypothetical protein